MWVNHTEIRCEEHYTYTLLRKVAEGLAILTGTLADAAGTFLPVPVAEWVDQNVPAAAGVVGAVVVRGYTIEA